MKFAVCFKPVMPMDPIEVLGRFATRKEAEECLSQAKAAAWGHWYRYNSLYIYEYAAR